MERDTNLDMFRGFMMLYVIFVIHGLYWFHVVSANSILFSLLLFEMPVIFYISGAAQKLSSTKTFKQHVLSRCKRVIVPYIVWCIGTVCVLITYGDIKTDWINLVTCRSLNSVPYVWHIWFIYPYLIVSILGFFLIKAYRQWNNSFVFCYSLVIAAIILLMDCTNILHQSYIIRHFLAYSVFYVCGFTYKEQINIYKRLILLSLIIIIYLFLIMSHTYPYATQLNKFPPNFAFLCFGMIAIISLSLLLNFVVRFNAQACMPSFVRKLLQFANVHGFELYLYQSFAMQGYAFLARKYWQNASAEVKYVLVLLILPFLLFPIAYIARMVNSYICRKLEVVM